MSKIIVFDIHSRKKVMVICVEHEINLITSGPTLDLCNKTSQMLIFASNSGD